MDDDDLAKIRAARLAELQNGGGGGGGSAGQSAGDTQQQKEAESRKQIISQICTPEAVDRLGRIAMVKASRATDLENRLIMLARTNQLRSRVTDEELVKLIGMVDDSKKKNNGGDGEIVFHRRKAAFDDDDDDFFA